MTYTDLIPAAVLKLALTAPKPPVVFDCHFDLTDPDAGQRAYAAGHIPGARYLHLDHDLSGSKAGQLGRHPLPDRQAFRDRMNAFGIGPGTQVVAYDQAGGMYAARLWWLLRWIGHEAVAVLDGGQAAWVATGSVLVDVAPPPPVPAQTLLAPSLVRIASFDAVRDNLQSGAQLVIDARSPERFRGEGETLDPVGGHIPGAANRFFKSNLGPDGAFKPAAQLKAAFDAVLNGRTPDTVISQCGSGVTACHNLLAMQVAGLTGAALYPGSWSEWSRRSDTPKAVGD